MFDKFHVWSLGPCLHFIALIPCHYHRLNETGDTYIWRDAIKWNRIAIKRKIVAKLAKSLLARVRVWWRRTTINYKWENSHCRKSFNLIPEWWILTCFFFETRGFLTLGMLWKKTRTPKDQTCWQNWENILREAVPSQQPQWGFYSQCIKWPLCIGGDQD